jgi:exodeoxyribonuclease VII large subunit
VQVSDGGELTQERPLTVGELTRMVKGALEARFPAVWVTGELTNCRLYSSGHLYFSLSGDDCLLKGVMFRPRPQRLGFEPEDGLEVTARGRISVYPPRGDYQLIADELLLRGEGALRRAFEELKRRLAAEGLFAGERKRPLPRLPRRVGVVTSRDGAALRDILNVLERRHAGLDILLRHSTVQGLSAGAELARAVRELGECGLVDVLIVGRGGGSYEDLFCFNDEELARAVYDCPVPVISAVGHEVDFSICDLVADVRAPTPSAAAELVTAERAELGRRVRRAWSSLLNVGRERLRFERQRLNGLADSLRPERLSGYLDLRRQRVDALGERLTNRAFNNLNLRRTRLDGLRLALSRLHGAPRARQRLLDRATARLERSARRALEELSRRKLELQSRLAALNPEAVIARGFGHLSAEGAPLSRAAELSPGDTLDVVLSDGGVQTIVRRRFERGATELRTGPGTAGGDRRPARGGRLPPEQTDLPL